MVDTFSICSIMRRYNTACEKARTTNQTVSVWRDIDKVNELYSQMMRVQFIIGNGNVYDVDTFIDRAKSGYFCLSVGDGSGRFVSADGNMGIWLKLDVEWIEKNRANYPFIVWYDK